MMSLLDNYTDLVAQSNANISAYDACHNFYKNYVLPLIKKTAGPNIDYGNLIVCAKNINNHALFFFDNYPDILVIDRKKLGEDIIKNIDTKGPQAVIINNCDAMPYTDISDFYLRKLVCVLSQKRIPLIMIASKEDYDFCSLLEVCSSARQVII